MSKVYSNKNQSEENEKSGMNSKKNQIVETLLKEDCLMAPIRKMITHSAQCGFLVVRKG